MAEAVRFEEVFPDLYRLAYRVSFKVLGDRGDAEDVAQEALARAHVRWVRLRDRPEGWVVTVATNLAIDRLRRRSRSTESRRRARRARRDAPFRAHRPGPGPAATCRAASARSWCFATWRTGPNWPWPTPWAAHPAR